MALKSVATAVCRVCAHDECNATFTTRRANRRFCSDRCRIKAWEARHPRVTRRVNRRPPHPSLAVMRRALESIRPEGI